MDKINGIVEFEFLLPVKVKADFLARSDRGANLKSILLAHLKNKRHPHGDIEDVDVIKVDCPLVSALPDEVVHQSELEELVTELVRENLPALNAKFLDAEVTYAR